MEGLYAGSDLHGNSNFLGIIDAQGKRAFKKRLPNELSLIRQTLQPFQGELGINYFFLSKWLPGQDSPRQARDKLGHYGRNILFLLA
jgi:hypothetical protein